MRFDVFSSPAALKSNNLNFFRFLFATMVIFSHSFVLTSGAASHDPLARYTHERMDFGSLAVGAFFAISGFLVSHSWLRSASAGQYAKKRALRILPGFYAAFLFCALVVIPLGSGSLHAFCMNFNFKKLLATAALVCEYKQPGVFMHNPLRGAVNGSLWTIQFECWCYACVPLLAVWGAYRRKWIGVVALAAAITWFELQICRGWRLSAGPAHYFIGEASEWPHLLSYFLAGAVFYVWRAKIPYDGWIALFSGVALLAAARFFPRTLPAASVILGTYLLFFLAFEPSARLARFAKYGDFSYGVYLYAFPVQQLAASVFGKGIGPYAMTLFAFPIVLGLAAASWHCVESPMLRLKGKKAPGAALPALASVGGAG